MNRQKIVETLTRYGFSVENQDSWGKARLIGGSPGSLYVADNYLSATGHYASFENKVSPSERDHKNYPVWKNQALSQVLALICEKNEKV